MSMSLTPAQMNCLEFLKERIGATGIAPSYDEIRGHLNLASKSRVTHLLDALVERGAIRRLKYKARAIEISGDGPKGFVVNPIPEVRRAIDKYAAAHGITIRTAAEEALRAYFVEAA
jgi:SOS-response transcriptional repressor LexA